MTPRDRAKKVLATYNKMHTRRPLRKQFVLEDLISREITEALFEAEQTTVKYRNLDGEEFLFVGKLKGTK